MITTFNFSIILLVLYNLTTIFSYDGTINFQIHSNNDLNEMKQLLLKSASRFKFDLHYVDSLQCRNNKIIDSRGCFLLNHDSPLTKYSKYNSSSDLVNYLRSSEFQQLKSTTEAVSVALCFKSVPNYCDFNSQNFNNWLSLTDEFFDDILTSPINGTEFILDGDVKPMNCLVGKWPGLNSVWINTNSPQDALISNSIENDYYRFQILNDPENFSNWTWMAQNNYGKFSNSTYPYQLWEVICILICYNLTII